jgi:cytochrome c5
MRSILYGFLIFIALPLLAQSDFDRDQIEARIRPVGQVHLEQTLDNHVETLTKTARPEKKSGQAIYEQYCSVCHRDGLAGAPKFRNTTDWTPRRAKQSLDVLTAVAIKGLNAMPAKGTCQECTEADLKAAIEYMVPQ